MFKRRTKAEKIRDEIVSTARTTNPAVPVAGAAGFALLGAALVRRMRKPSHSP